MIYKTFTIKSTPENSWARKANNNFEVMQEDFYDADYDYESGGYSANEFFFYAESLEDARQKINDLIYACIASERYTAKDFKLSAFEAFAIECEIFTTELKRAVCSTFKTLFS
jgi:hypothetical protein